MNDQPRGLTLTDIRAKIDACDDRMFEALADRFELVEMVKFLKSTNNGVGLPLRPAREMQILRRLVSLAAKKKLNPQLLVRLWPLIISEASLSQANLIIHVPRQVFNSVGHRLRIRDYFGGMPIEECRDEAQALFEVDANPGDICIVETEGPWVEPFLAGKAGKAEIMAALPVMRGADEPQAPRLLVVGHAPQEQTGEDETIVISKGALPRAFSPAPLWQAKSGDYRISALPGFIDASDQRYASVMRQNPTLGLKLVGRYPSAIGI